MFMLSILYNKDYPITVSSFENDILIHPNMWLNHLKDLLKLVCLKFVLIVIYIKSLFSLFVILLFL